MALDGKRILGHKRMKVGSIDASESDSSLPSGPPSLDHFLRNFPQDTLRKLIDLSVEGGAQRLSRLQSNCRLGFLHRSHYSGKGTMA